jgi:hypothetical protein
MSLMRPTPAIHGSVWSAGTNETGHLIAEVDSLEAAVRKQKPQRNANEISRCITQQSVSKATSVELIAPVVVS